MAHVRSLVHQFRILSRETDLNVLGNSLEPATIYEVSCEPSFVTELHNMGWIRITLTRLIVAPGVTRDAQRPRAAIAGVKHDRARGLQAPSHVLLDIARSSHS